MSCLGWRLQIIQSMQGLFESYASHWKFTIPKNVGGISSEWIVALLSTNVIFKGILWDRRWSTPSIRIFSHTCWFFLRQGISNHKTKQASKFQSDPSTNCFTIDVWNINCWRQQFIFLLSYCFFRRIGISFYTSSVVFWHVIFWE